jgi:hypothetical protein
MRACTLAFLAALAGGCSQCSLGATDGGDDGTGRDLSVRDSGGADLGGSCSLLTAANCRTDPRCQLVPGCCGGADRCVPLGPPPVCTLACVACAGLDEKSCAANSSCAADYCYECSCTPTYVGCRLSAATPKACPPLGCPQPLCTCDGLGEAACKAASATMGCTANYCPSCTSAQTYNGCSGPNEGAPACPLIGCATTCRTATDCAPTGQICRPPDAQPYCGGACIMQASTCASDADCRGSTTICEPVRCACNAATACIAGCTGNGDCPVGQVCNGMHRCQPQPCAGVACPANFRCATSGDALCQRLTCTSDKDCAAASYCVTGYCYTALGACSFPPPP